jgi:hypothetical protein
LASYRSSSFDNEKTRPAPSNNLRRDEVRRSILLTEAKKFLISRRTRQAFLDETIFGEPGWDMLLALYISEETEARLSIDRLMEFARASPTISLRWIDHLSRLGLIRRLPHPTNDRTAFIELTEEARFGLDSYFSRILAMSGEGERSAS